MQVVCYLQREQTREEEDHFFMRLGLKKWKAKYYVTHMNDEDYEDCDETYVEVISTAESSYGAPSSAEEEGHDLRVCPKQVCDPLTERSKLFTKLRSLYSESRKEDSQLNIKFETLKGSLYILAENIEETEEKMKGLYLDIEKFLEQCKEAEVLGKQSKLLAVKCDDLGKNKDYVVCEAKESEGTRTNMDDLNLKSENVGVQCKAVDAIEDNSRNL
jgi:hypothetical protein